jgi:hypothetical protein
MSRQWLRACSLVVAGDKESIELAGPTQEQILQIRFSVSYHIKSTPAVMNARVYNLSKATVQKIISLANKGPAEWDGIPYPTSARVTLKAGYIENYAQLFDGQIYQMKVGREAAVDSYLDIFAADGKLAHLTAMSNRTFASGYTAEDVWKAAGKDMGPWGVSTGATPDNLPKDKSPRGKVIFGPTSAVLNQHSDAHGYTWNIESMQLQGLPIGSFKKNSAVVINSMTGMIGVPEQTEEGIKVTTLLNPAIRWGTRVTINNRDIARLLFQGQGMTVPAEAGKATPVVALNKADFGSMTAKDLNDPEAIYGDADGLYVVLWAEHAGETRWQEWYTRFSCFSVDPTTVPVPQSPLPNPLLVERG